jgi:hypothetical protein
VSKASGYSASEQWTSSLQGFAWGVSAIAILIGGLGMMSAMVMSVLERTREIGTLRAVGWSRGARAAHDPGRGDPAQRHRRRDRRGAGCVSGLARRAGAGAGA